MCNHCSNDPREQIAQAERALWGLRLIVNQMAPGEDVTADGIGALLSLIHDQMDLAATAIQDYIPREPLPA